jgi:tRNA A-37 threonylcarbamoyl transferase component Bud32
MSCLPDNIVFDFVGGRLSSDAHAAAAAHLEACADCRFVVGVAAHEPDWMAQLSSSIAERATLPVATVLADRYCLVRFLGRGGMGTVYEAEDIELERRVALKTLSPDLAGNLRMVGRLKREAQLASRVTHVNVCRFFDFGVHREAQPPIIFITMELLPGETLRQRLRQKGPLSPAQLLPIVEQVARGLEAAHAAGVVHRDFKSDNIMISEQRGELRAVITDFGLARPLEPGDVSSSGGHVPGTAAYMAPEQALAEPLTPATDIYALGVVMYEALTGELPFRGESPLATALARLQSAPPPPRTLVPDLDETWERVVLRCLERDPAARFASAADVVRALTMPMRPRATATRRWLGAAALALAVAVAIGVGAAHLLRSRHVNSATASVRVDTSSIAAPLPPPPPPTVEKPPIAPVLPTAALLPASLPVEKTRAAVTPPRRNAAAAHRPRAVHVDDVVDPYGP